jgi:hypothetical protein
MAKFKSTFALLDVMQGRAALAKRVEKMKEGAGIPITISGRIVRQWGNDDGTSIEFEVAVDSVVETDDYKEGN